MLPAHLRLATIAGYVWVCNTTLSATHLEQLAGGAILEARSEFMSLGTFSDFGSVNADWERILSSSGVESRGSRDMDLEFRLRSALSEHRVLPWR